MNICTNCGESFSGSECPRCHAQIIYRDRDSVRGARIPGRTARTQASAGGGSQRRAVPQVGSGAGRGAAAQAGAVLRQFVSGSVRTAAHISAGEDGKRCWQCLMPVQILIPLGLALCRRSMLDRPFSESAMVGALCWAELLIILLITLRLTCAIVGNRMTVGSAASLISVATLPFSLCISAAGALVSVLPMLSAALAVLGLTLSAIIMYMGYEYACIRARVRGFGWFAVTAFMYISVACVLVNQLML